MIRPTLIAKIFDFIEENGLNRSEFEGKQLEEPQSNMPWRLTIKRTQKPYFDISCPASFESFRISRSRYAPTHIVTDLPRAGKRQLLSEAQLFSELKHWLHKEAKPAIEDLNETLLSDDYTYIVDNKAAISEMLEDYNKKYHPEITLEEFYEGLRIEREAARKVLLMAYDDKLIEGLPKEMKKGMVILPKNMKPMKSPSLEVISAKGQSGQNYDEKIDWTWPRRINILGMTVVGVLLVLIVWQYQEHNSFFKFLDKHLSWIAGLYITVNGYLYFHYWKRR